MRMNEIMTVNFIYLALGKLIRRQVKPIVRISKFNFWILGSSVGHNPGQMVSDILVNCLPEEWGNWNIQKVIFRG